MATAAKKGSASFTFTSITGMTSPFLLAWPLDLIETYEATQPEQRWVWRSMDRSGRSVVTVEAVKVDVLAVIRADDEPDRLRKFLRLAMDGDLASLAYKPSSGASAVSVDIDAVGGETSVRLRPDRGGIDWEAGVRLVVAQASVGSLL